MLFKVIVNENPVGKRISHNALEMGNVYWFGLLVWYAYNIQKNILTQSAKTFITDMLKSESTVYTTNTSPKNCLLCKDFIVGHSLYSIWVIPLLI